jgi:NADPH-dependent curcumin reductase CurA
MPINRQFILEARPTGLVAPENFKFVETPAPTPGDGEILVRHHFLSLDPYMRGRLNDSKSYAKPQEVGAVMRGGAVGEVVASNHVRFKIGDKVVGMGGWQDYALSDGGDLRVIDVAQIPIQAYLGTVGMPGVTAWYGLNKIIAPRAGETIVVSAATGAVGSVVGQLAKLAGANTIGIAGGPDKCAYALEELGYDRCIDHKSADFVTELSGALPKGVDGLFENVGGIPFATCVNHLNTFARIAICGLIASYEGAPTTLDNVGTLLITRSKMEGFIVSDHLDLWPQALAELAGHVAQKRIRYRETIVEGLEKTPVAFIDMLKGRNFGKQLVKVA